MELKQGAFFDRYERVTDLKQRQPNLKVLLSIGGLKLSTSTVSKMLASWETRDWFIVNAITYLRYRNFDGLDLALQRLGADDKRTFATLCKVRVPLGSREGDNSISLSIKWIFGKYS